MMRRPVFLAVLAAALFAPTTLAKAPYDQYDRFEAASDTIVDSFTKLTWKRVVARPEVSYVLATQGCVLPYRLPTVKELQTLVDEQPANLAQRRYIDADAFPAETTPTSKPYWTSTLVGNGSERFVLDFATGATRSSGPDTPMFFRCVKGPN